jgi:outer membrane protein OmpA-like peptidoglycan-associated protein
MCRTWKLAWLGGVVALSCAAHAHAQDETGLDGSAREARLVEVRNSFDGPTGGIRVVDAASGPTGSFRLALNTEFFIASDYFAPGDETHYFAGNFSLSVTPTDFLEVFASAEVTSAWDNSNDPMLIQRVADLYMGLKGFYGIKPWVAVGGDFSLLFPGGVGDASSTFRATSFGFRGNVTFDLRDTERRDIPLITRFNAQYWFDNTSNLTQGIEDRRYDALGGLVPRPAETRHLLTPFERYAFNMNRTDFVRLALGFEAPLKARKVGLHPLLEWQWDIPINRQSFPCPAMATPTDDGCLANAGVAAFPMLLTLGLRILPPPKGLAFTVGADVGLTGTSDFVRELAPTAPYNVIIGVGYAFDPRRAAPVAPPPPAEEVAALGQVRGHVLESGTGQPIAGVVVEVVGQDASPQLTDAAGRFVTYAVDQEEVLLELSHPDYESTQCSATVPSQTDCELVLSDPSGTLRLTTVDGDGKPVLNIVVSVRGPSSHRLTTNEDGVAIVENIEPGAYTAHVDDAAFLIAARDFDVETREDADVQLRILRKPTRARVVVKNSEIILRRQIIFATGSEEILPASEPVLVEVADVMLRNPELELIEIQGHTDNSGSPEVNMQLSQQRAEAVRRWLVDHGVEPGRLRAKGYGPTHPIAPNITAYHRARNRRVQFKIVQRADVTAAAAP